MEGQKVSGGNGTLIGRQSGGNLGQCYKWETEKKKHSLQRQQKWTRTASPYNGNVQATEEVHVP